MTPLAWFGSVLWPPHPPSLAPRCRPDNEVDTSLSTCPGASVVQVRACVWSVGVVLAWCWRGLSCMIAVLATAVVWGGLADGGWGEDRGGAVGSSTMCFAIVERVSFCRRVWCVVCGAGSCGGGGVLLNALCWDRRLPKSCGVRSCCGKAVASCCAQRLCAPYPTFPVIVGRKPTRSYGPTPPLPQRQRLIATVPRLPPRCVCIYVCICVYLCMCTRVRVCVLVCMRVARHDSGVGVCTSLIVYWVCLRVLSGGSLVRQEERQRAAAVVAATPAPAPARAVVGA